MPSHFPQQKQWMRGNSMWHSYRISEGLWEFPNTSSTGRWSEGGSHLHALSTAKYKELDAKMAYLQTTQQFLLTKHVTQFCTKIIYILWISRLLRLCCWGLRFSAVWCLVIGCLMTNILRQHNNLIFKGWKVHTEFFMVLFLTVGHQAPNDMWCHIPKEQGRQCESHHYSISKCSLNSIYKT